MPSSTGSTLRRQTDRVLNRHLPPGKLARESESAAALLRKRGAGSAELGVVLGSGLGGVAAVLEDAVVVPYGDVPGMREPGIPAHAGLVHAGTVDGVGIVAFEGRSHSFEGVSARDLVFPAFLLRAMGVRKAVFTCAAGGVSPALETGDIVLVRDHVDLSRTGPLRELRVRGFGRFVDMIDSYDPGFTAVLESAARAEGIAVRPGVLGVLRGPSYETAAEIGLLRRAGVDVVTMSTVPEVIAARHLGLRVACIALVTNTYRLGGGRSTTHHDVVKTAESSADSLRRLLAAAAPLLSDKH